MKGFASGLLLLSSLIGFTSPWGVRRSNQEQTVPVVQKKWSLWKKLSSMMSHFRQQ